jgi:acetyltransferase-like isoleucine patch superfamily enzyme
VNVRIHPTAIVEEGVRIGSGTSVWDNVHLRGPSKIGKDCILGGKSYVAYGVTIGDRVKINAQVYIPTGVEIGDGVMIAAGTIFTNDRFPRATTPDLKQLRPSEPDAHTLRTTVGDGASIGAGCLIGPGLRIGRFAMIGMGAVVTVDVPDFALMTGSPARLAGYVCRCGEPVLRGNPAATPNSPLACGTCGRTYLLEAGKFTEPAGVPA